MKQTDRQTDRQTSDCYVMLLIASEATSIKTVLNQDTWRITYLNLICYYINAQWQIQELVVGRYMIPVSSFLLSLPWHP